jgi:alcohol dehydrogenase class IV
VGIVSTNGRHILEFEGADMVEKPGPPHLCIPHHRGLLADVSQVLHRHRQQNGGQGGHRDSRPCAPTPALIDPVLTTSMPGS